MTERSLSRGAEAALKRLKQGLVLVRCRLLRVDGIHEQATVELLAQGHPNNGLDRLIRFSAEYSITNTVDVRKAPTLNIVECSEQHPATQTVQGFLQQWEQIGCTAHALQLNGLLENNIYQQTLRLGL